MYPQKVVNINHTAFIENQMRAMHSEFSMNALHQLSILFYLILVQLYLQQVVLRAYSYLLVACMGHILFHILNIGKMNCKTNCTLSNLIVNLLLLLLYKFFLEILGAYGLLLALWSEISFDDAQGNIWCQGLNPDGSHAN